MFAEVRSATRLLVRWRGGAIAAALTLAIGIGTTTGLQALARVLLADMRGVPAPDRVARIYASNAALGVERSPVALTEFDTSLSHATSFSAIGAYSDQDATIGSGAEVRAAIAGYATPGFFTALGVAPSAGRLFSSEDVAAERRVAIVSEALWRRQFADVEPGDASITVDGIDRAVIGVMPAAFSYPFVGINAEVWLPLTRAGRNTPAIVTVYARLREDAGWPAAGTELAALSRGREPWIWRAIPIQQDVRYRAISAYAGTLGPALLVLLIACINVACMLMARGIARDRELTVRRALGATRARVVRQLLTENLLLAAAGGLLGAAFAFVMLRTVSTALRAVQPALSARLPTGIALLPVALGLSAMACVLFGTVPALRLARRDVAAALNGLPSPHRMQVAGYGARDVIVFAEVACAVGLVVWTAMLVTLFAQIRSIAFAFPADHVVAMRIPGLEVNATLARLAAIPGVTRAASSSGMIGGRSPVRAVADGMAPVVMSRVPVGEGFFDTLGVPIVRGRAFAKSEMQGMDGVLVLSESAAAKLASDGNALGMRLTLAGGPPSIVIGICRDAIDYGALSRAGAFAPPEVYAPYSPSVAEAVVLARVSGDAHGLLRAIAAAAEPGPGARPPRPVVLGDEARERERQSQGGFAVVRLIAWFALLTLVLAASGVFAVIAQSVAQRTREFGIRLAIGATPAQLLRLVLARETKLIGAAIATGLIFVMAGTRALFVELAALSAIVPSIWIAALVLSAGLAGTALVLATWRIVRLDPAVVLRRP